MIVAVLLGAAMGVIGNWIKPPENRPLDQRTILAVFMVLVVLAALVAVLNVDDDETSGQGKPSVEPQASCENGYVGSGDPVGVSTDPDARFITSGSGIDVIAPRLTWTGLLLSIPAATCNYRIELDARLANAESGTDGSGWGYGVGVCNRWNGAQPSGFIAQYALISQGGGVSVNTGRFSMPYVNDGRKLPVDSVDTEYHHWIIELRDGEVYFSLDFGAPIGPFPATTRPEGLSLERSLPPDCVGAGAFLRVLGAQATFRNIAVAGLH